MTDFTLRPTRESDLDGIIKTWSASFGDSEEFILSLAENCCLIERGVCAVSDGEARAFMFAFDGLEIAGRKASYIYALCTQREYRRRGLGRAVLIYAAQQANERGSELVFLRPADKDLAGWYASAFAAIPFAPIGTEKITPSLPASLKAEEISFDEYLLARGKCPWSVPSEILIAEGTVHRHYGGGFFRCGSSYVCAEKYGGGLYLREIIGDDSALAAAALAEYFGVKDICLPRPSSDGIPLMFIPPYAPENIASVPLMPFTFD